LKWRCKESRKGILSDPMWPGLLKRGEKGNTGRLSNFSTKSALIGPVLWKRRKGKSKNDRDAQTNVLTGDETFERGPDAIMKRTGRECHEEGAGTPPMKEIEQRLLNAHAIPGR